ncbi:hypothetical protein [Peptoniphilus genitalis]|uniref:hypothetical protein n=1 Tax=Peptoniphilus genitalis TaxID=3036303 RepID=UPI0024AE873D|nr:hypothetical protein [Peptoniphilus sp. Marseille-Q7072]
MLKLNNKNLFLSLRRLAGVFLVMATVFIAITLCYSFYMVTIRFICIALLKIVELGESSFSNWI